MEDKKNTRQIEKIEIERQSFIFENIDGKEIRVPILPLILHNGLLDGKYWDKIKAIPNPISENGYDIFFKSENGARKVVSYNIIKDIDEISYKSIISEAEGNATLLKIRSIFMRVYP
jgi:hypothetical protein